MGTPWEVDDTVAASAPKSQGPTPWSVDDTNTPTAKKLTKSVKQQLLSGAAELPFAVPELVANLGTGTIGQAVGGLAGLVGAALPGPQGQGAQWSQNVADALTYKPRTESANAALEAVGQGFGAVNEKLGQAGEAVAGNVGRSVGETVLPVAMTVAPAPKLLKAARERTVPNPGAGLPEADMITFAKHNAGKMEALDLAKQYGIAVDPASVNPTTLNKTMSGLAGRANVNRAMVEANQGKWGDALKQDLGIAKDAPLDAATIDAVRSAAAAPMQEIRGLGPMVADPDTLAGLESLRPEPTIGGRAAAVRANQLIDEAVGKMKDGMTGDSVMSNIQSLRKRARDIYKMSDAGPERLASADISMKIANQLESMVESNLQRMEAANPYAGYDTLLQRYRDGRTRMAKSYALEDAIDFNTKQVDPTKIAAITKRDNALTGAFSDIGRIAGNFPEVVKASAPDSHSGLSHRFLRSTTGGMLGAGLGGAIGGAPGAMVGTALGTTAGEGMAAMIANALTGKRGQARAVAPVGRELWQSGLDDRLTDSVRQGPKVERFTHESTALVPAGANATPRGPVGNAPTPYNGPNWQYYQRPEPEAPAAPALENIDPGRIYEQQRAGFRAEEEHAQVADRAAQIAAEQEQLAAELRARRPARGGVELWQPPPKGATMPPSSALDRAVEKLAKGQGFDLTSEERIAWNKAKGDIYAP